VPLHLPPSYYKYTHTNQRPIPLAGGPGDEGGGDDD
jgi:hypothetical protein